MKKTLLIFIDGLQYDAAIDGLDVSKESNSSLITPGVGFSNNIYPEMLCGLSPDQIEYFNEWSPVKQNTKKLPFWLRGMDIFRPYLYINAGLRKIILNKLFKINYSNIPFKYAHYFQPQGSHNFRDLTGDNLLHKFEFTIIDAAETGKGLGKKDEVVIDISNSTIVNDNYLVSLVDLDNIAHVYGASSKEFKDHLSFLNHSVTKLINKFMSLGNENQVFLFSDHGMVDVGRVVDFDIEKKFGPMDKAKYLYFIDSTYLRIWVKDSNLKSEFTDYLNSLDFGSIISDDERIRFGISNVDFGDLMFRADEGVMFVPNFYGSRPNLAMHGYDSSLRSQSAIFTRISYPDHSTPLPTNSKGIYSYLNAVLK